MIPELDLGMGNSTDQEGWRVGVDQALKELDLAGLAGNGAALKIDIDNLDWPSYDVLKPSKAVGERFKYQQCEYLLDQAADLLDRALKDRTQWEELYNKWFTLALTVWEARSLNQIDRIEQDSEFYDTEERAARAESTLQQSEQTSATDRKQRLTELAAMWEARIYDAFEDLQVLDRVFGAVVPGNDPRYTVAAGPGVNSQINTNDDPMHDPLGLRLEVLTRALSRRFRDIEKLRLSLDRIREDQQIQAASMKVQTFADKAGLESTRIAATKSRTRIAGLVTDAKALVATLKTGGMHYRAQMEHVQERYRNDFNEAMDRMRVAAEGLRLIYGYAEQLPLQSETAEGYFDACVLWVRRAISFVVRFNKLDQVYQHTVSVRSLAKDNWESNNGAWTFRFGTTDLPFAGSCSQVHVRLRGLAVSVVPIATERKHIWQVKVTTPRDSECKHLNNTVHDLAQHNIAPCICAHVTRQNETERPLSFGELEVFNTSPYGKWQLELMGPADVDVTDVILHMTLVVRIIDFVQSTAD